jgi:hypothetical protein
MKIAVLGWGSLIWKPEGLQTTGRFLNDGPTLPIEFCRTSQDGRLTLVIDEMYGAPCVTYHTQSSFDALDSAIENLRIREGMASAGRVGFVNFITHEENQIIESKQPGPSRAISTWAQSRDYDAVIWTALGNKFKETTGVHFSVDSALSYLEGLCRRKASDCFDLYPTRASRSANACSERRGTALARGLASGAMRAL